MTLGLEKVQPKHLSTGVQIQSTDKQNIYSRWLSSVICSPGWWHQGQGRSGWLTWKDLTSPPYMHPEAGSSLNEEQGKLLSAEQLGPNPKIKGWCPAKCIFLQHILPASNFFFRISFHIESQLLIPVGLAGFKQQLDRHWGCPHQQQGVCSLLRGLNKHRHGTHSPFGDEKSPCKPAAQAAWGRGNVTSCCQMPSSLP